MTEKEISEGNKLIALFDGWRQTIENEKQPNWWVHPTKSTWITNSMQLPTKYTHNMKYHKDWNWLMPVVHKCCADIKAMGFDKRGSWSLQHGYVSEIYLMKLDNPIEKVWLEVVKYIKQKIQ